LSFRWKHAGAPAGAPDRGDPVSRHFSDQLIAVLPRLRRFARGLTGSATEADDRVGGENIRSRMTGDDGAGFFCGEAHGVSRRQLLWARGFVDIGGIDAVGDEANLSQQLEATRRRGGEHEGRHRHKTLIPADAARRSA